MRDRPDEELLSATLTGDADAFAEFYRRHLPAVLRYCAGRGAGPEVAADLAAEVFAAALNACERYRPEQGPAVAWLYGVARNVLLMSRRRGRVEDRARRRLAFEPIAITDHDLERVEALIGDAGPSPLALLETLPPEQRSALEARVLAEREYEDIARSLRCSEAVVRQRVSRALRRLRVQLGERT
jgi:RNA polymerase sigma factor (sigma-70 family)